MIVYAHTFDVFFGYNFIRPQPAVIFPVVEYIPWTFYCTIIRERSDSIALLTNRSA